MGRKPRIHIEGGLYFVTTRGDHAEALFKDDIDRAQYLELLSRYKGQYGFKLFAYILMPAFIHLIIEIPPGTTISEIMHVLNSTYTKYFNGRYNRKGHLFQGRFKSVLVEKSEYLAALTRYTHLVPVEGRMADKAEGYKWSSYPFYMGMDKDFVGMEGDARELLANLSQETNEQKRLYKEFIESIDKAGFDSLKKQLQGSWILGSKGFVEGVKEKLKEDEKREEEEKKKAWIKSRPHKIFILAGSIAVVVLTVVTLYLYRANIGLVRMFKTTLEEKEAEFIDKLKSERDFIQEDLSEKYRADMVSYQAMQKRLEIEKKKTREMEKKTYED
ncbi:MAG: transposase [Candidatus Omnitrophica bacterium]|nr:transposase [Candidatus Omnitrophota bacterium]